MGASQVSKLGRLVKLELTWEEIRARSERNGVSCWDCWLFSNAANVPCLKHTRPSERAARARAIGVTR